MVTPKMSKMPVLSNFSRNSRQHQKQKIHDELIMVRGGKIHLFERMDLPSLPDLERPKSSLAKAWHCEDQAVRQLGNLPRRGPRSNVFPVGYARGRPHTAPGALGISEVRRSRRSHTWTAGSSLHHDPQHHNISFIKVRKWPTERPRTCGVLDDTSMNDIPKRDTVTMDKASPPSSCLSGIEGITSKGQSATCAKHSGKKVPAVVELVSQMSLVEKELTEDGSGEQRGGDSRIEHVGKAGVKCIMGCGDSNSNDLGLGDSGLLDEPSKHKINPDEKSSLTEKICDRDNSETPDDTSAECKLLSDKKSPVDESRDLTDCSPRPPSSVPALWYISEHNVYQQSVQRLSSTLKAAKALNRNSGVSMNRKPKFAPHAKQKKSEWNLLKERDKIVV